MARRTLHPLGETEMELLQHVWELGRASVGEVHQRVLETREVAYTTVMTVMKKLASKGYLAYTKEGNAYVYQAARPPEEVRSDLLRGLLQKAFGGSHRALIQTLARTEPLSEEDVAALAKLVDTIQDDEPSDGSVQEDDHA